VCVDLCVTSHGHVAFTISVFTSIVIFTLGVHGIHQPRSACVYVYVHERERTKRLGLGVGRGGGGAYACVGVVGVHVCEQVNTCT